MITSLSEKHKDFFGNVYEVVKLIPHGRVTSYGAIAAYLGMKRSARMVGWAMNAAHGKEVPAHRVVNRNGNLSGKMHFSDPDAMANLLRAEGVEVENDTVKRFKQVFWDPSLELGID